jgi:hypothetical protein
MSILISIPSRPAEQQPIVLKPSLTAVAKPARGPGYAARDTVTLSKQSLRQFAPPAPEDLPRFAATERIDKVQLSLAGSKLRVNDGAATLRQPSSNASG